MLTFNSGPSAADVVPGAPESLIEQNVFHMQLKLTLAQRNQELAALKEINGSQKKEFDKLTAKFETLEKTYK
jgi:hypothetical protein